MGVRNGIPLMVDRGKSDPVLGFTIKAGAGDETRAAYYSLNGKGSQPPSRYECRAYCGKHSTPLGVQKRLLKFAKATF
jgi:hypothetical protein